ncbi:hypothetical protein GLYMA_08G226166v4 [Glycine max]|nr:hypothetical protein GLYMA_08G226166v4 [Glycine max]KAH1052590.1 hypothetical protein GYH30_022083 [Glycine max]
MGSPAPKGDSSSTPPPKPPNRLPNANFMKPSFKEKVVGQPLEPNVVHNLVEETFLRLELKEGNFLLLKFTVEASKFEKLCETWRKCLVVKLLGKTLEYLTIRDRLKGLWFLYCQF